MKKSDFFYDLPQELIAQHPAEPRDSSRLMVLDKKTGAVKHDIFHNIAQYIEPGDCLILNDTKVLPARLYGTRVDTGSVVEFLLLNNKGDDIWEVITGPGKKARKGHRFTFHDMLFAEIVDVLPDGNRLAKFTYDGVFFELLDKIGEMPLPHYIRLSMPASAVAPPHRQQGCILLPNSLTPCAKRVSASDSSPSMSVSEHSDPSRRRMSRITICTLSIICCRRLRRNS